MKSLDLLPELTALPTNPSSVTLETPVLMQRLQKMDRDLFAANIAVATEGVTETLFDVRNVDDDLQSAFEKASPSVARQFSLHDRYEEMLERGERSVTGFISNLKGKVFEVKSEGVLEELFPDFDFTVVAKQNEAVLDLTGLGQRGEEVFVQAKIGGENYASDVAGRMEEALESELNLWFLVSQKIFDELHSSYPELVITYGSGLINAGVSNAELTTDIKEGLETLAGNLGLDVPDSLVEALPYVGEVITGVRLIHNLISTEHSLAGEELDDRAKVHGIRTLGLLSKFGINQLCMWAGVGAGSAVTPGVGSLIGGVAGLGGGIVLNRLLQPRIEDIAIILVGDGDNVFYLMNKVSIDSIGASLAATHCEVTVSATA